MITKDRLSEIADLANTLPDKYQVAAFQELVRHELGGSEPKRAGGRERSEETSDGKSHAPPQRPEWFSEILEQMPEQYVFASGNRDAQAAWALVELFRRGEPATVAAARKLIKDELGVTPEARPHMSTRLGSNFTPKHATRVPLEEGRGYRYEPTRNIVEMFPEEQET